MTDLPAAVAEHRRLRHLKQHRMLLVEAPTDTSRVYAARLHGHRHLVREISWARVGRRRLVVSNAVMYVDTNGELVERKEW